MAKKSLFVQYTLLAILILMMTFNVTGMKVILFFSLVNFFANILFLR